MLGVLIVVVKGVSEDQALQKSGTAKKFRLTYTKYAFIYVGM